MRCDDSVLLGLGEAMAYNDRNLGVIAGLDVGGSVVPANAKAYVDFFNRYARELTGTRERAANLCFERIPLLSKTDRPIADGY